MTVFDKSPYNFKKVDGVWYRQLKTDVNDKWEQNVPILVNTPTSDTDKTLYKTRSTYIWV